MILRDDTLNLDHSPNPAHTPPTTIPPRPSILSLTAQTLPPTNPLITIVMAYNDHVNQEKALALWEHFILVQIVLDSHVFVCVERW